MAIQFGGCVMGKVSILSGGTDGLYSVAKVYADGSLSASESAWCADFTEDLSGQVASCEVPNEPSTILIRPGHGGRAVYSATRDGILKESLQMNPARFYHTLAMLPGWQKWKPTYRFGVISNLDKDNDTCDVTLETSISTQQALGVNYKAAYSGVTVEYMECNAEAFENGDSVLVEFTGQDFDSPKVIGFKDNPNPCGFIEHWYGPNPASANDWLAHIYFRPFSGPVEDTEEDPWVTSPLANTGGRVVFTAGTPDTDPPVNGSAKVERYSPIGSSSAFQWVVATLPEPLKISNGLMDLTIDSLSIAFNPNTGTNVYPKITLFTSESGPFGGFSYAYRYEATATGAFTDIDLSAIIDQHLTHVAVSVTDAGFQAGVVTSGHITVSYIKIV